MIGKPNAHWLSASSRLTAFNDLHTLRVRIEELVADPRAADDPEGEACGFSIGMHRLSTEPAREAAVGQ